MAGKKSEPGELPENPDDTGHPDNAGEISTPQGDSATTDENPPADSPTLSGIAEGHAAQYEGFDPAIHAMNEDGTPKRKVDGSYALKRGRKAGTAGAALPPKNAPAKDAVGVPGNVSPVRISIDEAARQSANMVINAAVWTLGQEVGEPKDKAEAEGLKLSFKNYYEARGVPNIPPEIGLLLALGSYIGPRLMHEKSQSKMEKVKLWIAAKLHK